MLEGCTAVEGITGISPQDVVLVTGGTGTLGEALVPQLLACGTTVRVLSRDETKQGALAKVWPQVEWRLGDVRDPAACRDAVRDATVVIHAASLKYVDLSELQPSEYALTNTLGTLNVINAVLAERGVRACVGISTDKACQPINTYGLTKALLERFFVEAAATRRGSLRTIFTVCRYGNVIGSRGSVVLKWQEAKARGERVKVTDPAMTRFFFTVRDAVALIGSALLMEECGTIIAAEMPATDLGTLASLWGEYDVIGDRRGEKRDESLLSEREMTMVDRDASGLLIYRPLAGPTSAGGKAYTSSGARQLMAPELRGLVNQWL